MINLIVKQIDDTTISIEDILSNEKMILPAEYRAEGDSHTGMVHIRQNRERKIYTAHYSEIEVDELGILPTVEETVEELNKFIGNFNSGGNASGVVTGDSRLILSIQKRGLNGTVFPNPFVWESTLKVLNVVKSKHVVSASFEINGVNYDTTTLKNVSLPAGEDLVIDDLVLETGWDVGSITLIFEI